MPPKSAAWQMILLRHAHPAKARDPWNVRQAIDVGRPEIVGLGPDAPQTMRPFLNTTPHPGSPWYILAQFADELWLHFLPSTPDLVSPRRLGACSDLNVLAVGHRPDEDATWLEVYKRGELVVSFRALGHGDQPLRVLTFDSREHGKNYLKKFATANDALSGLFQSCKAELRRLAAVESGGVIRMVNPDGSPVDENELKTLTLQFLVPLAAGENPAK